MKNLKNNLYYVLTKIENPRTEISTKRIKKFHRYKAHIENLYKNGQCDTPYKLYELWWKQFERCDFCREICINSRFKNVIAKKIEDGWQVKFSGFKNKFGQIVIDI